MTKLIAIGLSCWCGCLAAALVLGNDADSSYHSDALALLAGSVGSVDSSHDSPAKFCAENCTEGGAEIHDHIAMLGLLDRVCEANRGGLAPEMEGKLGVGCWRMLMYHGDDKLTSAVYQKSTGTGPACVLAFSGLHATNKSKPWLLHQLAQPIEHSKLCGSHIYRPFYLQLFDHLHLTGWQRLHHALADPSTCGTGGITLTGLSLGGALADILAACISHNSLDDLVGQYKPYQKHLEFAPIWAGITPEAQEAWRQTELRRSDAPALNLPSFSVKQIFTYGSPGASRDPLENGLSHDTCFPGRRYFISEDPIAYMGRLGHNSHARIDTTMIFIPPDGSSANITAKDMPCLSDGAAFEGSGPIDATTNKTHDPIQSLASKANVKKHGPGVYRYALAVAGGFAPMRRFEEEAKPPKAYRCARFDGDWCACNGTAYYGNKHTKMFLHKLGPESRLDELVQQPHVLLKNVTEGISCNAEAMRGLALNRKRAKHCYCVYFQGGFVPPQSKLDSDSFAAPELSPVPV